jgi:PAS domain S-box-containing protein
MHDIKKGLARSILLIDDDPVFRRLMAVMFTQDGFSVTTANDAESGLRLLEQKDFQVAVVDYRLPDQTGIDFFEKARRNYPLMMRILVTAHTTEEILLEAINRGEVFRYLNKPVHMGLLRSTVEQSLALYELAASKRALVEELEHRNKELEEKNSDLRNYYHLMGELKAQQDQILSSLPEPFLLLRADRRILKCNQAAIDMLGFPRGEMLGKSADDIFAFRHELVERIEDVGRSGLTYFETELKRKSSTPIKVKVALNRFQGESVERNQIALVIQDITSVKQLEELLKTHSQRLEQTVEDQILQIVRQQRALAHSEKLSSLGTLVAGAAHEINTSGSFIRTNLEVLLEYWLGIEPILANWLEANPDAQIGIQPAKRVLKDIRGLLEDLDVGAAQLSRIVEGLLAYSRKDVRRKEIFSLVDAVEIAMTVTGTRINKSFKVIKHVRDGELTVYGNRGQIVQVVVDLLMNAGDAWDEMGRTDQGIICVVVRGMQDGRLMRVTVADTAGGMSSEISTQVFDPFFTTKKGKGTGLGLSICHGIIGEHGGDIWVKSRPLKGSAFSFTLPTYIAEEEPEAVKG